MSEKYDQEKWKPVNLFDDNNYFPIDSTLSALMNKYGVVFINGRRYYEFDLMTKLPILDNTVPFLFKYKDIEIYESSWNKMALRIVEELNKKHFRSTDYLLKLEYWWSKTNVFSRCKRTNFTPYRDIYLNTNHTSTHSMMSIQCLISAFGVSLSDCYFLIRRHPISEPTEIRNYFREKNIDGFRKCMKFRGYSETRIEKVINNFRVINQLLATVSQGFDDFFLFDDYQYFSNYKAKTIQKAEIKFISNEKYVSATKKSLNRLDEYYKNKEFYDTVIHENISCDLKEQLRTEIEYLFTTLDTSVITANKLYARMAIVHPETLRMLGEFNSSKHIFTFVGAFFENEYYCKRPFISKDSEMHLDNDGIIYLFIYSQDEITVTKLNNYADKMHLKRISNYTELMIDVADDYVQINQDKIIKKDLLNLSKDLLNGINSEIRYYIQSFGEIDSEKYLGFSSLPNIGKTWNKYLLLGIVRTYFKNMYKIRYTNGTYKTFSFTISLL